MEGDRSAMFVDGDGLIHVQSEVHGHVIIRVPAGERRCDAGGLDELHSIAAGDEIHVLGTVTGARDVTVCARGDSLTSLVH